MSRTPNRFAVLACAALLSTAALCEEAKNPLIKPKTVKAEAPIAGSSLPPPPDLRDHIELPTTSGNSSADQVATHLSMLRVVATVGNRAILRGPLGKSGNLAISSAISSLDARGGPVAAGQVAPAPSGGQQDEKSSPVRSITVTSGDPMQLAGGIWVRPEIVGPSVRLYMQTTAKEKSEALVYASTVEIADVASAELAERQFESAKKQPPK